MLLSIGYAACHWCHVMAHESFEDADTAALMNRLFVNIKVDREERPDLDHLYRSPFSSWPSRRRLAAHDVPDTGPSPPSSVAPISPGTAGGRPLVPPGAARRRPTPGRERKTTGDAEAVASRRELSAVCRAAGSLPGPVHLDASPRPAAERSRARRHAGAPKFPDRRSSVPVAECLPHRRAAGEDAPHLMLRTDVAGRHLRSPRRRLCALLDRRGLAGAAFREDAVRQCAAPGVAGAGPRHRPDPLYARAPPRPSAG